MKAAGLILVLLPLGASAGMYKWTDQSGHVHYSQTPPPAGSTGSEVAPAAPPASSAGSVNGAVKRYRSELDHGNRQRAQARQQAEQASQRRQELCAHARTRAQAQTQFQGRIFSLDENGQRVYQSADENAQARAILDQQVSENCD